MKETYKYSTVVPVRERKWTMCKGGRVIVTAPSIQFLKTKRLAACYNLQRAGSAITSTQTIQYWTVVVLSLLFCWCWHRHWAPMWSETVWTLFTDNTPLHLEWTFYSVSSIQFSKSHYIHQTNTIWTYCTTQFNLFTTLTNVQSLVAYGSYTREAFIIDGDHWGKYVMKKKWFLWDSENLTHTESIPYSPQDNDFVPCRWHHTYRWRTTVSDGTAQPWLHFTVELTITCPSQDRIF